jgi:hypothetical protein
MATATNGTEEKVSQPNRASGRGPSYPALTIEEALRKADQFWNAEKRSTAPMAAAAGHWGYSSTSSSGKVAVAALLHFGLMVDIGASAARTVKLTPRALDIILDMPNSPKRLEALRDAVRTPKLYADIMAKWPASELPSDQTLRYYLVREKNFNEASVEGFLKDFRASLAYARLDKPDTITEISYKAEVEETALAQDSSEAIGRGYSPDDHTRTARIAAQKLGLGRPVSEQEIASGKLGRQNRFRLLATGEVGSKELSYLIRLLEAQKAVLAEEEEEEDLDSDGNPQ